MTFLLHFCQWLAGTAVGTGIRESDNLFSIIETVHVLGIIFTAGTIAIVDLRILGLALARYAARELLAPLVKVTWIGFLVQSVAVSERIPSPHSGLGHSHDSSLGGTLCCDAFAGTLVGNHRDGSRDCLLVT